MGEAREFGRFFDDFQEGDVYKHWPGKTVTQAEDILFCSITMNQHPLHSDDNYAAVASPSGRAMVVGNLVYSVVLGQSVPDVSGRAIANLEVESLKHANPTFHGDTIYSQSEVLEVRPSRSKEDRGVVRVRTIGYTQEGTVVCEFVRSVLVPRRGHGYDGQPGRPEPRLDG
jgi:acyl dehydratase